MDNLKECYYGKTSKINYKFYHYDPQLIFSQNNYICRQTNQQNGIRLEKQKVYYCR